MEATMHKCKHGCNYEHAKRGPMNLHELYHCKMKGGADMAAEKKPKEKKAPELKCDCEKGPSLAFMNKGDSQYHGALAAGYKKICTECGEVFK